jgi:hypothetical protein
MESGERWTVDVYESEAGDRPAWSFMAALEGRSRAEAFALVKLLEERGKTLRRPHSGALAVACSSCGATRCGSSTCSDRAAKWSCSMVRSRSGAMSLRERSPV